MLLSDLGADVVRIDRKGAASSPPTDIYVRGRRSAGAGPEGARRGGGLPDDSAQSADAMFEGFRPGVMERLGLGPEVMLGAQPEAGLRPA